MNYKKMWHIYTWRHDCFLCAAWLIDMCDMTHSYVWCMCVARFIHMCDINQSLCDWLWNITNSHVGHDLPLSWRRETPWALGEYDLQQCAALCNTLQNTATHCKILQLTAKYCNTLQNTVTHCKILQNTATHWKILQHTARYCNTLQNTATLCNTSLAWQREAPWAWERVCSATHYNTLQHTAPRYNTLQHTAFIAAWRALSLGKLERTDGSPMALAIDSCC